MEPDQVSPKKGAIKGTLRVKGQANRSGAQPKCDLPAFCERCKKKTLGSLQLPCGRQVRLCEACSLEFYDILMEKISQNDSEFQSFLREQKKKEQAAKEKEQSTQMRTANRGGPAAGSPKGGAMLRSGRLAGPFESGEVMEGWKTSPGRGGLEKKPIEIFNPLNRPHSSKDALQMPSLQGVAAGGPSKRTHTSSKLSVQTDTPGNRRGSLPEAAHPPGGSPGHRWAGSQPGGLHVGQDVNLSLGAGGVRAAGNRAAVALARAGSNGSVGSSGSASSLRGSHPNGSATAPMSASAQRRHSATGTGGSGAILRSSEIRHGGKTAVGGAKPGAKPRGVAGRVGGHVEELLAGKAAGGAGQGASAKEIRQKVSGAMEDLVSLQGTRRA